MATPIKYDDIVLYVRDASIKSIEWTLELAKQEVEYKELKYDLESYAGAMTALNSWFKDDNGDPITFEDFPVITFKAVFWEAEDGSDSYSHQKYAVDLADLPADFFEKAVKRTV